MDSSNHWYGHAHLMAAYCGLDADDPPPIWGVLQHGWNYLHGFGPGHNPPYGFPKLVWSEAAVRRGQAIGWRDFTVVGSPWAYLLLQSPEPPPLEQREGTIYYPFHTWEQGTVSGDHHDLIAEIKANEDGPVTVCLYWIEYAVPEIRAAYESAGFRVICHGQRGTLRKGTDRFFLVKQRAELVKHRRVASNRLTTAIFYGASVGCDVGVYGDPMEFSDDRDATVVDGNAHVSRLFGDLLGARTDRDLVQAVTRRELGIDQTLSPEQLKLVLGWAA